MAAIRKALSSPGTAIGVVLLGLALLAYLAWAVYVTATDGFDRGLGVFLSVPALVVIVALVLAPFAAVAWLTAKLVIGMRASRDSGGGGSSGETITTNTFPC